MKRIRGAASCLLALILLVMTPLAAWADGASAGAASAGADPAAMEQALAAAKAKIILAHSMGVNTVQSEQLAAQAELKLAEAKATTDPVVRADSLTKVGKAVGIIKTLLANVPDPAPAAVPVSSSAVAASTALAPIPAGIPVQLESLFQKAIQSNTNAPAVEAAVSAHAALNAAISAAQQVGDKTTLAQKRNELRTQSAQFIVDTFGAGILPPLYGAVDAAIQAAQNKVLLAEANGANVVQSKQLVSQAVAALAQAKTLSDPVQAVISATSAGQFLEIIETLLGGGGGNVGSTPAPTPSPTPSPAPVPAPSSGAWQIESPRAWDYQPTVPSQSACAQGEGTTYEVGSGLAYTALGQVPWDQLKGCDTVNIHWQPAPYTDVIAIGVRGAKDKFIRIQGIPGPGGEKPVLEGNGAKVAPGLFSNKVFDGLGMIEILPVKGSPYGYKPGYIDINNLEIRNVNMQLKYTNMDGQFVNWNSFACGIYIERAENVAIRNSDIHDNSLGIFQNSKYDEAAQSRYLLIEGNYVHDNGNPGSNHEHNAYTEGVGTVYQFNWFGAPAAVSYAENIKDRSVGITFRYNYIESGIHPLALEDPESNKNWEAIQKDAWGNLLADSTYVYGNTIVVGPGKNGFKSPWGYTLMWFGDGTSVNVRGGNIYFHNNTVISKVDWGTYYYPNSTLFKIANSRNNPTVVATNNIFYATSATPGAKAAPIALFYHSGNARFANNWISPGWMNVDPGNHTNPIWTPTSMYDGSGIVNMISNSQNDPGFVDAAHGDYRLRAGSQAIDQGAALDPEVLKTGNTTQYEFSAVGVSRPRPVDGAPDLGAFEY